jgi:hypothetical protein
MISKKFFPVASMAAAFAAICLPVDYLGAQSPPAPPESAASESGARRRPTATFTFADAKKLKTRSRTGHFQLVGLHLNETVDIALQFPAMPSSSAPAQPLDGGKIHSFSLNPAGTGGLAVIRFQAANRPGLYRVLLPGLGESALLQFWVADPNNPSTARPDLLNRNH